MAALTPEIAKAIEDALDGARVEIERFFVDKDVGKVEINIGHKRLSVKALPERIRKPVEFETE